MIFFMSTHTPDLSTMPSTLIAHSLFILILLTDYRPSPPRPLLGPCGMPTTTGQRVQYFNPPHVFSYGPARLARPEMPSIKVNSIYSNIIVIISPLRYYCC